MRFIFELKGFINLKSLHKVWGCKVCAQKKILYLCVSCKKKKNMSEKKFFFDNLHYVTWELNKVAFGDINCIFNIMGQFVYNMIYYRIIYCGVNWVRLPLIFKKYTKFKKFSKLYNKHYFIIIHHITYEFKHIRIHFTNKASIILFCGSFKL